MDTECNRMKEKKFRKGGKNYSFPLSSFFFSVFLPSQTLFSFFCSSFFLIPFNVGVNFFLISWNSSSERGKRKRNKERKKKKKEEESSRREETSLPLLRVNYLTRKRIQEEGKQEMSTWITWCMSGRMSEKAFFLLSLALSLSLSLIFLSSFVNFFVSQISFSL